MAKSYRLILFLIIAIVAFVSCSPYKHLSKDGLLLSKNKLKINTKEFSKGELENLIIQDPNSSFFLMKAGMYFYSISKVGEDSTMSWFTRNTFRSWGEKPVELDENSIFQSEQNISRYLKTKGSFEATVTDSIIHKRKWYAPWKRYKRRVIVEYTVNANARYMINNFETAVMDSVLSIQVERIMRETIIRKGELYDEDVLFSERNRLVMALKERGYFGFDAKYVMYQIDTNKGDNSLNITLNVGNPKWQQDGMEIEGRHKVYTVRNIYTYPNYVSSSVADYEPPTDTSVFYHKQTKHAPITRFLFIHNKDLPIKTKSLLRSMLFQQDAVYSPQTIKRTYEALSQLRNFKYIDIKPLEVKEVDWQKDTLPVDFEVKLSMSNPINLSTGLEATYSQANAAYGITNTSNFGLEYNLWLQHTNIFRSAEIFTVNTKFAAEIRSDIFNRTTDSMLWSYFSAFEIGGDIGIEIPRFLAPFATGFYSMQFRPHTTLRIGLNYQKRRTFERYISSLSYGYTWKTSEQENHSFFPTEINLVKMVAIDDIFAYLIGDWSRRMRYQVSDHLVTDMRYTYFFNGQKFNSRKNYHYFRFNAEVSGNLLYLASLWGKNSKQDFNQYNILGVPFSQYIRSDADFVQFFYPLKGHTLVLRAYFGLGLSYGNSRQLPYEKNFFGGGANNLRAWGFRTLGPGAAKSEFMNNNMERSGDIAFFGNLEYRFPVFGFIEGAAFFDFGNVWLMGSQSDLAGGEFEFHDFYKELAAGVGLGLRLNFKVIILRFDFALKVFDPSQDLGERFVLPHAKFKHINVHFGLNYPF